MNQQLTLLWFYDLALNSVILNGCRSDCRYVRALIRLYSHVFYFTPYLLWSSDTDVPHPGLMLEGLDPCFSVVSLWGHRRHVGPVEVTEDLGHGFGLVEVRGNCAGKVIVACLVAEFGTGRGVAYLWNLKEPEKIGNLQGETEMRLKLNDT